MTERDTSGLEALNGQQVAVEEVDLIEDAEGIPSWIKVERELATVLIVPSLLQPRTTTPAPRAPRVHGVDTRPKHTEPKHRAQEEVTS
jgi:hypothetical protein